MVLYEISVNAILALWSWENNDVNLAISLAGSLYF